jgi:hypothetical protein
MPVENGALPDLKINILVAIHVKEAASFAVGEEERHGRLHLSNARVYATRHSLLRSLEQGAGFLKRIA